MDPSDEIVIDPVAMVGGRVVYDPGVRPLGFDPDHLGAAIEACLAEG